MGIHLKQTFAKEGQRLSHKAGRYAHARQFNRMKRAIKRQRTIVGRLHREIECKASVIGAAVKQALGATWHRNWPKSSAATDCIPRISVGYWPKMNKSGTTIYSIAPAQLPRFYKRQHRLQHLS